MSRRAKKSEAMTIEQVVEIEGRLAAIPCPVSDPEGWNTWRIAATEGRGLIASLRADAAALLSEIRRISKKRWNKTMFSSNTDDWPTPQEFYNKLNQEFSFDLDVCASVENAKCEKYFTKETDGLNQRWYLHGRRAFMNPPYGKTIGAWVAKAAEERLLGVLTVALLPSRTGPKWYHDHIWDEANHCLRPGVKTRPVKGRLKFGDADCGAPFDSVVVIFEPDAEPYPKCYCTDLTRCAMH